MPPWCGFDIDDDDGDDDDDDVALAFTYEGLI